MDSECFALSIISNPCNEFTDFDLIFKLLHDENLKNFFIEAIGNPFESFAQY